MNLKLEPQFSDFRPSPSDLKNLENHLGLSLPADYKAFLTTYNGGYVKQKENDLALSYFFKVSTQNNKAIDHFYGLPHPISDNWTLDEDTLYRNSAGSLFYNLIYQYKVTWDCDFQSVFLPIASGLGTNFCLSMRAEDYGKIYCMLYEEDLFEFDKDGRVESFREDIQPDFESFTELLQCHVDVWPDLKQS